MEGKLPYGIVLKIWEALVSKPCPIKGHKLDEGFQLALDLLMGKDEIRSKKARKDIRHSYAGMFDKLWRDLPSVDDLPLFMAAGNVHAGQVDRAVVDSLTSYLTSVAACVLFDNLDEVLSNKDADATWRPANNNGGYWKMVGRKRKRELATFKKEA